MSYTTAGRNAIGTSGKAGITHIGLCTDLAGTEVAGGTYARVAVTWGAMSAGIATNTGAVAVNVPAGVTPYVVSYYDALTAGNRLGDFGYGSSGQLKTAAATVDAATDLFLSKAHGYVAGDQVFMSAINAEALPTGVSATTPYFVIAAGLTTDAFAVSTTLGGSTINVTASGEVFVMKTTPNLFASAGQLNFAIGQLSVDLTMV